MATLDVPTGGAPLTLLNEEESMFRDAVRQFAEERVKPLVSRMDERRRWTPTSSRSSSSWG